ncbi:uncharacterized protein EI90DRAFT_3171070 [Cantharellus anzutake]|uniref:uncharacterized protein n=1 Tax=Cantharellus anzutake TaxID=1750568 RepID=UPI0019044A7F|nr:uncharacterized protein EI90DRAFT_3171070 [Cantharellus anzutake]KAF8316720.1 hypothetical protein EI90DRAFT_3171070 [Cantharellus anzutake]
MDGQTRVDKDRQGLANYCWAEVTGPIPVGWSRVSTVYYQVFPVAISKTATVGILSHQRAEDGRFPTPRTLEGFHPSRRRAIASDEIVLQDLHIIIRFPRVVPQLDPPILELYCLIHGDGANHIFPVQIASTESVGTLKKAIKEEKFALQHIDADTLNSGRDYLPSTSGWISTHHCSVSPCISNRVPKGRAEWASKFAQKAPSEKGKPKNFAADQRRNPPAFCFNRPPSTAATIPITLHNPIFGQFQDDCNTYIPTKADHDLKLSSSMSEFCDAEKGRVEKILEDLRCNNFCFGLMEVKSEIILGGAEPIFEAAWYYAANLGSNLPCFILYIAGEVARALLWTIHPHLQVVAPTLPLFYHTSDVDMRMQTARFLGAVSVEYYESELPCITALSPAQPPNVGFPHPTHFLSLDDNSFEYLRKRNSYLWHCQ